MAAPLATYQVGWELCDLRGVEHVAQIPVKQAMKRVAISVASSTVTMAILVIAEVVALYVTRDFPPIILTTPNNPVTPIPGYIDPPIFFYPPVPGANLPPRIDEINPVLFKATEPTYKK